MDDFTRDDFDRIAARLWNRSPLPTRLRIPVVSIGQGGTQRNWYVEDLKPRQGCRGDDCPAADSRPPSGVFEVQNDV